MPTQPPIQLKETIHEPFQDIHYFDRDLSWLLFNERVLMEAEKEAVPLLERVLFLSIFSSNLDEFYRVRMPALAAIHKLYKKDRIEKDEARRHADVLKVARKIIARQLDQFGNALHAVLPLLEKSGIILHYGRPFPPEIAPQLTHYFFTEVLSFLKPWYLTKKDDRFFPQNNLLYIAVTGTNKSGEEEVVVVNIPTEDLPRFFKVEMDSQQHLVFLDDIIKAHLHVLPDISVEGSYSFKVTRDAELDLDADYSEDLADKIERQIQKRDFGLATRFLHEPDLPEGARRLLLQWLNLTESVAVEGGRYHNLKDLGSLPASGPEHSYEKWPPVLSPALKNGSLLSFLATQEVLLHTPYQSYDTVLRFFNEAAIAPDVDHIFLTMYRVAGNSRIVNALLTAAHNGKKVTVLVELKARFDEANNIKWAKRLKKAGVQVLYTPNHLKVHAKVALVKRKEGTTPLYTGLMATGNLNEITARFYTDHVLMTSHVGMLEEVEKVFRSFEHPSKDDEKLIFNHLLVAQHNLQEKFLELIDREIVHARTGQPARIIIKLNNLEERMLIKKLYAASNAGVQVDLIVRGICCLVPGVPGMSENIRIRRIVDRYLEHGRVYIFHNKGRNDVYLGSADWMNRNIYSRVEVCFPVYNEAFKEELLQIIHLQLADSVQAVAINSELQNVAPVADGEPVRSQEAIYNLLNAKLANKKSDFSAG